MTTFTGTRRRMALVAAFIMLLAALAVLSTRTTPPVEAANGFPIYLDCTGKAQGEILGSVRDKGFKRTTGVSSFTQGIVSPRDSASGLPTGRRQHKPIVFTMDADRSALQLTQALTRNETLSCRFRFVRRGQDGEKSQYLTVTLTNASVARQQLNGAKNGLDSYEFELTYQKINWRWNEGSPVEVEDDWESQVS
jgi:type VI secretion system secreted protein Hcp